MPVYEYKCSDHGIFHELQTLADFDKPCACPSCGKLAPRIVCVAPGFLSMPAQTRKAHGINEVAQHQPKTLASEREHHAEHGRSCGCATHKSRSSGMLLTAKGEKIFPSRRPWMISH